MALLLHVVFRARSKLVATHLFELLSRMGELVRRDHPGVYMSKMILAFPNRPRVRAVLELFSLTEPYVWTKYQLKNDALVGIPPFVTTHPLRHRSEPFH